MKRLQILFNGEKLYEKDYVTINSKSVRILHVTMSGFLYNKQCPDENDYVTVTRGKNISSYYSDWDYLTFVGCDVQISEAEI